MSLMPSLANNCALILATSTVAQPASSGADGAAPAEAPVNKNKRFRKPKVRGAQLET
jgi:hypothetical protein